METLHWVREIVEKGAPWFAGHGHHGRKGLRSFSVSGRVKKPGVHLAPAGIVILSDKDTAAASARNLMKFFSEESCGQCTPCRVGTIKALNLMHEPKWDKPLIDELSQAMMDSSICGLGQAAPNPALCVLKYFPKEVG